MQEPLKVKYPQLLFESKVLTRLQSDQGATFCIFAGETSSKKCIGVIGIPKIYYTGQAGDYNVMVMERLGPTLEDLRLACGGRFSLKTGLLVGIQLVFFLFTNPL